MTKLQLMKYLRTAFLIAVVLAGFIILQNLLTATSQSELQINQYTSQLMEAHQDNTISDELLSEVTKDYQAKITETEKQIETYNLFQVFILVMTGITLVPMLSTIIMWAFTEFPLTEVWLKGKDREITITEQQGMTTMINTIYASVSFIIGMSIFAYISVNGIF